MLANNHLCKVAQQYFKQLETKQFKKGLSDGDILVTLRDVFVQNPNVCKTFADAAYQYCFNSGKCKEDDYPSAYELLATYGVLMSSVVFGFDTKSGSFDMYTSSYSIIEGLAQQGILIAKKDAISVELEKIQKALYESDRIKKSIKDTRKVICVRLDAFYQDGKLKMTASLPRTMPTLDTFLFVHFDSVKTAWDIIVNECQNSILKFSMDGGSKVRYVTLNPSILTSVYGEQMAKRMLSNTPDVYTQRFYLPSIGSSRASLGVTNIRLYDINSISLANLTDIDLSSVNMDYTLVHQFFYRKVSKASSKRLGVIGEKLGLDCLNAPVDELRSHIIKSGSSIKSADLWSFMKENDDIFKTDDYQKMPKIFGKKMDYLEVPKTVEQLSNALSTGLYKIVSIKKNGSYSTIIGTNDEKQLSRILGKDYYKRFESDGNRLRLAKKLAQNGASSEEITELTGVGAYGESVDEFLTWCDEQLRDVEYNKTVVKQSHLCTVRSVEAIDKASFYKNLNPKAIVQFIKLA